MQDATPVKEHEYLQTLVGEWTYEGEAPMAPDQPPMKFAGTESVRSIGGLWIIGEGRGKMPDGADATMIYTLGYDLDLKKYVGTWIGSMMTRLWVYEITRVGDTLNMESDGPSMTDPKVTARYRDAVEIKSPNHRVFTSSIRQPDGSWKAFMTTHYHRA